MTRNRLETTELRREVWDLRIQGMSVADIAIKLGRSLRAVYYDLEQTTRLIDATQWLESETAVDLARLDKLFHTFWSGALQGDRDDALLCLKVLERKSKMLGLDAPKRVDIRQLVVEWAQREGYDDPAIVLDTVRKLLPGPD